MEVACSGCPVREVRLRYEVVATCVRCPHCPAWEGHTERIAVLFNGSDAAGLFDDRGHAAACLSHCEAIAHTMKSTWIFQLNEVEIE